MRRLEEARTSAYYPSSPQFDRQGGRSTAENDPMACKVHRLVEAEKQVEVELAWETVFRRVDKVFPKDSPEGEMAWMLYHEHQTQAAICGLLSIDRQTARKRTDAYICHCAIEAAIAGLLLQRGLSGADTD